MPSPQEKFAAAIAQVITDEDLENIKKAPTYKNAWQLAVKSLEESGETDGEAFLMELDFEKPEWSYTSRPN